MNEKAHACERCVCSLMSVPHALGHVRHALAHDNAIAHVVAYKHAVAPDHPVAAMTLRTCRISQIESLCARGRCQCWRQNSSSSLRLLEWDSRQELKPKAGYSHEVELIVPPAVRVFCFKPNLQSKAGHSVRNGPTGRWIGPGPDI
ncbi:hypothetical protein EJ110_NYTH53140 [Nymphaea thermarum]|nr:hypothetical protein EJ110_NYTH53140 [Nymphaea thermarum]